MKKPIVLILGLLRIPMDIVMALIGFLLAYYLRLKPDFLPGLQLPVDPTVLPTPEEYFTFTLVAIAIFELILVVHRLYSLKYTLALRHQIAKIVNAGAVWLLLIMAYFFILRTFPFSRLALIYSWVLTVLFVILGRFLLRLMELFLLHMGIGKTKVLFVGKNSLAEKLRSRMEADPRYQVVGILDVDSLAILKENVDSNDVDVIIQTSSNIAGHQAVDIFDFCREHHISYHFVPDLLTIHRTNIEVETWTGIPVIHLKPTPLDGWGRVLKRLFDIIGAFVGLIILSPIFALIALLIKLDSKGTVFFKYLDDGSRVKRVGQYGKLFNFYKFRTMFPNTHSLRYTVLSKQDKRKGSPLVKIKNDPRVTRIGKFLRRMSLDELPQLWNVLKGEMSLVGPRPHLPEEVEKYKKHHKFALAIKPGITGLSQISGRSDLDFEDEIALDTYYIQNWSLWFDIVILVKTVGVVLRGYRE